MPFDPALTLQDLLQSETSSDDIVTAMITALGQGPNGGFPVTNWANGGTILTLLQADAAQIADTNQSVANLAAAGFINLAPGNPNNDIDPTVRNNNTWLDLLSFAWFNNTRHPQVFGQYEVTLTVALGRGPYTISPNGLWVSDSTGAFLYNSTNASPVTITSAATTNIVVQAQFGGSAYNTISGLGINLPLVTNLLGVTAATTTAPGSSSSSVVVSGQDFESDTALRLRDTTQWARLSIVSTLTAEVNAALSVVSTHGQVTGVYVADNNPGGPGTFYVYISTATGGAGTALVTDVNNALQLIRPFTSTLTTLSAGTTNVTVAGIVYIPTAFLASTTTAVNAAITAYQASLNIGDGSGPPNQGTVFLSTLYEIISTVPNVRNVDLTSPTVDTTPTAGNIVVLNNTLVFTGV